MSLRTPNGIVTINGQPVIWKSISVTNKNFYFSDTFEVIIPFSANPQFGFDFWADITRAEIEIYMGVPPQLFGVTLGDLTKVFSGLVDTVEINAPTLEVTITGRDFSSLFIDKKQTVTYVNQTASDIATELAIKNGLDAVVQKTVSPVGIFDDDYTQISNAVTEWDLLTGLAQQENFNMFVFNKELHFVPKPSETTGPFVVNYQLPASLFDTPRSDLVSIQLGRTLTLARDVRVRVRSFDVDEGTTVIESATSTHVKKSIASTKQNYVFNIPNLTSKQASVAAQRILRQITQHEILLNVSMPGSIDIDKNTPILIQGTYSDFDQIYYIDSLHRTLSPENGFTMDIQAKNHDTNTQVVL
jgi:phage protein D